MFKILTSLVFILYSLSMFGQGWLVPEASWTYCRFWPGDSPQVFVYTQDSVVNDTAYALIQNVSINGEPTVGNEWYDLRTTLLRQSGDTTYRRVNDTEYIFFVDGLEVGDGFTTYRSAAFYTGYYSCVPDMYLQVQDVYFEEIEGESFRHVVLEDTAFAEVYGIPEDPTAENLFIFIEGLGLGNNFPYWHESTFTYEMDQEYSCMLSTDGYEPLRLASYSNPSAEFVLFPCGVSSVENLEALNLKIRPNPATDIIYLETTEPIISVQLLDLRGQLLLKRDFNGGEQILDLDEVPSGVYLLRTLSNRGVAAIKVVVAAK